MSRWRARTSWWLRWGGIGAALCIAAVLVLSLYSVAIYDHPRFSIETEFGVVYMSWNRSPEAAARGWFVKWNGRRDFHKYWNFGASWSSEDYSAAVPLWVPTALPLGLSAVAWWRRFCTLRRAKIGGCRACGYDLAALPAGLPCPECGKPRP